MLCSSGHKEGECGRRKGCFLEIVPLLIQDQRICLLPLPPCRRWKDMIISLSAWALILIYLLGNDTFFSKQPSLLLVGTVITKELKAEKDPVRRGGFLCCC